MILGFALQMGNGMATIHRLPATVLWLWLSGGMGVAALAAPDRQRAVGHAPAAAEVTRRAAGGFDRGSGDQSGLSGGFSETDRRELPSGMWGCPSELRIHPVALTPTFGYWKQGNYHLPQLGDGLKWAVYVGWSAGGTEDADYWRLYDVPVYACGPATGCSDTPVNRLERPRISFAYDPAGLPAFAIGLDDGGVRYYEDPPEDQVPVHVGSIVLVRPDPGQAGVWTTELVPFGNALPAVAGRLDYPSLAFTPSGVPVITAIGYHAELDDFEDGTVPYEEGRAYAEPLIARRTNSGWQVHRVLDEMCSCGINSADISNARATAMEQDSAGDPPPAERVIATSPLFTGVLQSICCPFSLNPYQRYLLAYPSLSVRPGGTVLRLAFSFGQQFSAASSYRNYLYSVDFDISNPLAPGALPILRQDRLKSNVTLDPWNDFGYTAQSDRGKYVVSVGKPAAGYPLVDAFQVWQNTVGTFWAFVTAGNIPTIPNYDRFDFRFWLPATVRETPDGTGLSFLTPRVVNGVINEVEKGTTLSLVSTELNPGGCGAVLCAQTIVEEGDQYLSFDASVAFGAFPPERGRQDEAFALLHSSLEGWPVVIKPQNGPLESAADYGDFDFDGEFTCNDDCAFEQAVSGSAWTANPLCDVNVDGAVDDFDLEWYEEVSGCCGD